MTAKALRNLVGENVRARRELLGISQSEVARLVGVTPAFISQLESGKSSPSLDSVAAIAEALHCEPAGLLENSHQTGTVEGMDDVLTVTEAAELSELSRFEISRKCRLGIIRAERKAAGWFIQRSALVEFLKAPVKRGRPKKSQHLG